jgi:hypothetical protein
MGSYFYSAYPQYDVGSSNLKVVATPPIGPGTDGAGFDPGLGLAFSSNGGEGTLSIIKEVNGKYTTVDTVSTERGARTRPQHRLLRSRRRSRNCREELRTNPA